MAGTRRGVELHFHTLPGIDDGPETVEESVELLCQAAAEGTEIVVATPHVRPDFVNDVLALRERVEELRAAAAGAGIELLRGAELGHDMVERLSQAEP